MRILRIVMLTLVLATMSAGAEAAVITFDFTATISFTSATGGLALTAAGFPTISGSISYDTSAVGTETEPLSLTYPTGVLTINEFDVDTGMFGGPAETSIFHGPDDGDVHAFFMETPLASEDGPFDLYSFLLLGDSGLSSTALPTSLSLLNIANILFFDQLIQEGEFARFVGTTEFEITSISPATTVPEPATLLLLGAGLSAVAARRRLKKRT